METLNIIIPTYNEENNIEELIVELKRTLQKTEVPSNYNRSGRRLQ